MAVVNGPVLRTLLLQLSPRSTSEAVATGRSQGQAHANSELDSSCRSSVISMLPAIDLDDGFELPMPSLGVDEEDRLASQESPLVPMFDGSSGSIPMSSADGTTTEGAGCSYADTNSECSAFCLEAHVPNCLLILLCTSVVTSLLQLLNRGEVRLLLRTGTAAHRCIAEGCRRVRKNLLRTPMYPTTKCSRDRAMLACSRLAPCGSHRGRGSTRRKQRGRQHVSQHRPRAASTCSAAASSIGAPGLRCPARNVGSASGGLRAAWNVASMSNELKRQMRAAETRFARMAAHHSTRFTRGVRVGRS